MAAGWFTVTRAIGLARSALQDYRQIQDEAAQKQREAAGSFGKLSQMADTTQQYAGYLRMVTKMHASGATDTEAEASDIIFDLASAGQLEHRGLITQLKAKNVIQDPGQLSASSAALMAAMGKKETGGFREVASKAFGASKFAPATAEQILAAAAQSGVSAGSLGFSDEAVMAATAVASKVLDPKGGADKAASHLSQLMNTLYEKGDEFKGKTFLESIETIQGMNLTGETRKQWFGRGEAMKVFDVLTRNKNLYKKALGEVQLAEAEDRVGKKLAIAAAPARQAAAGGAKASKARLDQARERLGTITNQAEFVQDSITRGMHERNVNRFMIYSAGLYMSGRRLLGGDEHFVDEGAGLLNQPDRNKLSGMRGRLALEDSLNRNMPTDPAAAQAVWDKRDAIAEEIAEKNNKAANVQVKAAEKFDRVATRMERAIGGGPALGGPREDK